MKTSILQRNHLIIISLLLLLFLSGCAGAGALTPTASPTVTLRPTATALPLTATPTSVPTAAEQPTGNSAAAVQAAASGDRAAFVSETYPDNSVLEAGESFTKAFELRNAGSATWTTDYALVRDETVPAGETLGAADRLALPQAVGPGETLTLELPLTAPEDPGTYTVYWTLQDAAGAIVPVDGVQRVWATIRVCADGEDCSAPVFAAGGPSASGVSFELSGVSHDAEATYISFCITVENPRFIQYLPHPSADLILDGIKMDSGGASMSMPSGGVSCMEIKFNVSSEQYNRAGHVVLVVERIEGSLHDRNSSCETVKPSLAAQYPGLNIQCDPSNHSDYISLSPPAGMSTDEAHQIVLDAIVGAIYGPWDLTIK